MNFWRMSLLTLWCQVRTVSSLAVLEPRCLDPGPHWRSWNRGAWTLALIKLVQTAGNKNHLLFWFKWRCHDADVNRLLHLLSNILFSTAKMFTLCKLTLWSGIHMAGNFQVQWAQPPVFLEASFRVHLCSLYRASHVQSSHCMWSTGRATFWLLTLSFGVTRSCLSVHVVEVGWYMYAIGLE